MPEVEPIAGDEPSPSIQPSRVALNGNRGLRRVVLVTQDEPLYLPHYLDRILSASPGRITVLRVLVLPLTLPRKTQLQTFLYFIFEFYGIVVAGYLALLRIWFWLADAVQSPANPSARLHSVSGVCRRHGVPVDLVSNINDPAVIEQIRGDGIDVLFSLASSQIFKTDLLKAPREGCLNIHSALLPSYRGFNANFWVLAKGETTTGITVHRMTPAIDAGEILQQKKLAIEPDWSLDDLYSRVIDLGSEMVVDTIERLDELNRTAKPQDPSLGSYYSLPQRADVREFRRRGRRFFRYY